MAPESSRFECARLASGQCAHHLLLGNCALLLHDIALTAALDDKGFLGGGPAPLRLWMVVAVPHVMMSPAEQLFICHAYVLLGDAPYNTR